MLPWNYGFHPDTGHLVFLGAYYAVLTVMAGTLIYAAFRSRKDLRSRQVARIRWHSDFHDLPARDRVCRHVLTGEFQTRECPHAFDCRECDTHAKLITVHPAGETKGDEILGMSFPADRLYHRGHTWVHREGDGTVTIGLDDLGSRLLGNPDAVTLPAVGSQLEVNGPAFQVRKKGAAVRVLSPVDGEVVETGGPDKPWYLRIRPAASDEFAFRHLLRGTEIHPWVSRELERLQLTLSPHLADGGIPIADLSLACPEADWDTLCAEMFLEA